MITDMTEGSITKNIWKFCIPLLISGMFQQIYTIADSMIVGRFVSEHAFAAVGNSYEITLIFLAFATGCNIGCSVVISQYFGAKRIDEMKTAVSTTFISCSLLGIFLTIIGRCFSGVFLEFINTPSEIMADSQLYMNIYTYGVLFVILYNVCTGIFTALGDSKTPLLFLICSSVTNVALDLLFVVKFGLGVGGAAWATFIAQAGACVASAAVIKIKLSAFGGRQTKIFSASMLAKLSRVAVPSIFQQSFVSVGNIIIQSVVNSFGPAVIAGYSAAVKMNNFAISSFMTLANGMSNFAAQNIGAKKYENVKKGVKSGLIMAASIATPFVILYMAAPQFFIKLFISSPSADALKSGVQFLRTVSVFYYVVIIKLICDSVIRGAAAMKYFLVGTFTDLVLRVVLSFVFSSALQSSSGIWISWPFGWAAAAILSCYFYKTNKWLKKDLI